MKPNKNIHDYSIILVIASLVFGTMQVSVLGQHVVAAIFCLPFAAKQLLSQMHVLKFKPLVLFILVWLLYATLSLFWTIDYKGGYGQLFVLICNMIILLGLYHNSQLALQPQKSFVMGWMLLLLLTFPIAFWEILTDNHLEKWGDFNAESSLYDPNGESITRKFAAVTYKNLNSYVTLLVIALPVLLMGILSFKNKFFPLVAAFFAIVIVLINASRGGIVCVGVILMVFLFHYRKVQFHYKKLFTCFAVLLVGLVLVYYAETILLQFMGRLVRYQDGSFLDDPGRFDVIRLGLNLCFNSGGFGCGVGSMEAAYATTGFWLHFAHNMTIEFLVEYGFWLFMPFAILLIKAFWRLAFAKNRILKAYGQMVAIGFVPMSIIDDSYFTHPFVWVYLATVFSLSDLTKLQPNKTKASYIAPNGYVQ